MQVGVWVIRQWKHLPASQSKTCGNIKQTKKVPSCSFFQKEKQPTAGILHLRPWSCLANFKYQCRKKQYFGILPAYRPHCSYMWITFLFWCWWVDEWSEWNVIYRLYDSHDGVINICLMMACDKSTVHQYVEHERWHVDQTFTNGDSTGKTNNSGDDLKRTIDICT